MTLGRNTIMSLSRRNAASESAKKAVARGSWFVKAHHHSEWAVVKYHSGPPFGTAPTNHKLIPHEPRTTNNKKSTSRRPTYPAESRVSLSGCILSHHQVTRFGISDSHGFARRKAPLLTMHYVYITFQAGRPSGRPLRATNYEPQKSTDGRPTYPAESRLSLSGCILSHHQVTRFGISDSHGFARRKAPSKPVPCLSQGTLVG